MDMLQILLDGVSEQWKQERSKTQMTLGKLIAVLERFPKGKMVANLHNAHSYRGYYCDLAFKYNGELRPARELLNECKSSMGKIFCGYKGGDFVMGELTPIWIAEFGCTGEKLIKICDDGTIETENDD